MVVNGVLGSNDSDHGKGRQDLYRTRPHSNLVSGELDKFMMVFIKSLWKIIQESSRGKVISSHTFFSFIYQSCNWI